MMGDFSNTSHIPMDKQTKNCEDREDLNNTMNKLGLVAYFPELNKEKCTFFSNPYKT